MNRPTFTKFKEKALSKLSVNDQYNDLKPAYELRKKLIGIRKKAGLTQEEVATILHTQKSNISRLESASTPNSPKLSTIEQYAHAVGYDVEINFIRRSNA